MMLLAGLAMMSVFPGNQAAAAPWQPVVGGPLLIVCAVVMIILRGGWRWLAIVPAIGAAFWAVKTIAAYLPIWPDCPAAAWQVLSVLPAACVLAILACLRALRSLVSGGYVMVPGKPPRQKRAPMGVVFAAVLAALAAAPGALPDAARRQVFTVLRDGHAGVSEAKRTGQLPAEVQTATIKKWPILSDLESFAVPDSQPPLTVGAPPPVPAGGFAPDMLPDAIDQKTATITPLGGTIQLSDGAKFTIPSGGMNKAGLVSFRKLRSPNREYTFYHVVAPAERLESPGVFELPVVSVDGQPVEAIDVVHIHDRNDLGRLLPNDWKPGDATVRVRTQELSVLGIIIPVAAVRGLQAWNNRESNLLAAKDQAIKASGVPEIFFRTPQYLKSAGSMWCWACTFSSILHAGRTMDQQLQEPQKPQVLASVIGADIMGGPCAIQWSVQGLWDTKLFRYLQSRSGATVETRFFARYPNLVAYIIDNLSRGYPVALDVRSHGPHTLTLVGYNSQGVYLQDNNADANGQFIGAAPWEAFFDLIKGRALDPAGTWVLTTVIKKDVRNCGHYVSLNVRSFDQGSRASGCYFTVPNKAEPRLPKYAGFLWDGQATLGMMLVQNDVPPARLKQIGVGGMTRFGCRGLQVVNTADDPFTGTITVSLVDQDDPNAHFDLSKPIPVHVEGTSAVVVAGEEVPLLPLVPPEWVGLRHYSLRCSLLSGKTEIDRLNMDAWLWPLRIDQLIANGGAGANRSYTLKGVGFDQTPLEVVATSIGSGNKPQEQVFTARVISKQELQFEAPTTLTLQSVRLRTKDDGLDSNEFLARPAVLITPTSDRQSPLSYSFKATVRNLSSLGKAATMGYRWDFGDNTRDRYSQVQPLGGTPGDTATFTAEHAYQAGGKYPVTAELVENSGGRGNTLAKGVLQLQVYDAGLLLDPPNIIASAHTEVPFAVKSSNLSAKPRFEWTFGDGTPAVSTTRPEATHLYQRAGMYSVAVKMFDLSARVPGTPVAQATGSARIDDSRPLLHYERIDSSTRVKTEEFTFYLLPEMEYLNLMLGHAPSEAEIADSRNNPMLRTVLNSSKGGYRAALLEFNGGDVKRADADVESIVAMRLRVVQHGLETHYASEDGKRKTSEYDYENGRMLKSTEWYDNGKMKKQEIYGKGDGDYERFTWNEAGKPTWREVYRNRTLQALDKYEYHPNGQQKSETHSRICDPQTDKLELDGAWATWYPDGKREELGQYAHGDQVGPWTSWYDNGAVKGSYDYLDAGNNGLYRLVDYARDGSKIREGRLDRSNTGHLIKYTDGKKREGDVRRGVEVGQWK
jgi:antitoxin component YwqK of YwqJK toxin-antitoxin module